MTYRLGSDDRRQLIPFGRGADVPAPPIDDSSRDVRLGIIVAGLFFVVFLRVRRREQSNQDKRARYFEAGEHVTARCKPRTSQSPRRVRFATV